MLPEFNQRSQIFSGKYLGVGAVVLGLAGAAWFGLAHLGGMPPPRSSDMSSQSRKASDRYIPTPAEWASLTIEPVAAHDFRAEHITEGKIAVDEDRCTPVFSPYTYPVDGEAGRSGGGSPCAPSSRRMGSERNGILCSSSLRNACELTSVPSLHATPDFIQCFIMTASSTPLSPLP
jgi:hypothetical protein